MESDDSDSVNSDTRSLSDVADNINDIFSRDDEDIEPIATEEEKKLYRETLAAEEEENNMLKRRFEEKNVDSWCKCKHCKLDFIIKQEECFCCYDIDRCRELLAELVEGTVEEPPPCVTNHPGFLSGCLDEWVLKIAAIGLKTRRNKRYTLMYEQNSADKHRFLRSVSYRQYTRLVWEYIGNSRRLPLPCCAYNKIREQFPSADGQYKGFEEEDDEEQNDSEDETEDLNRDSN